MKPWMLSAGLAALAAAAGGYVWWQGRQAQQEEVATALDEAERELARRPMDRSALGRLRRRLEQLPGAEVEPELLRMRARVRLAAGQLVEAWDLHRGLAQAVDAAPADLLLGARILLRRHALSGARGDAHEARRLAEQHHRLTDRPASLLLAWQAAHRALDPEVEARLRERLLERHPDSPEAELLRAWGEFFAADGADRVPMQRLLDLELRFEEVPLELEIMVIVALLQTGEDGDRGAAQDRLGDLLPVYQAVIDLRYYAAVETFARGAMAERDAHLDWLLQNAADDPRHPAWRAWRQGR